MQRKAWGQSTNAGTRSFGRRRSTFPAWRTAGSLDRVEVGVSRTAWFRTCYFQGCDSNFRSESAIVISSALRAATRCDIVELDLFDRRRPHRAFYRCVSLACAANHQLVPCYCVHCACSRPLSLGRIWRLRGVTKTPKFSNAWRRLREEGEVQRGGAKKVTTFTVSCSAC